MGSNSAWSVLRALFPDVFNTIRPGDIYSWREHGQGANEGWSGVVVATSGGLWFVSFLTGQVYVGSLSPECTKEELERKLASARGRAIIDFHGPSHFSSWGTKPDHIGVKVREEWKTPDMGR